MCPQTLLRAKLSDQDESVRAFAAEDAGFDDDAEHVEPLVDRIRLEPSRFVREAILSALCRMTHASVCDQAAPLLQSEDAFLRSAAVTILQSRGPRAVERLAQAFPLADADVRKLLLDAASTLPGEEAERVLLMGLDDDDVNVRIAAVEYLGERARPELKGRFEAVMASAREPMLISTALAALEQVGDAASWEVIEYRYRDAAGFPTFLAPQLLRVMAKLAPESGLPQFFAAQARLGAASLADWLDGLKSFQERFGFRRVPAESFDVLRGLLGDGVSPVDRFRLLKWMGRLDKQPGIVPALAAGLESREPMVRHGAAIGLGLVGTADARALMAARLENETDDDVRTALAGDRVSTEGAPPS